MTKYTHPIEEDFEFEMTNVMGKGAFGVVVVGIKINSKRSFAIKFIDKVGQLTRIEREIKLLTDLDHANILRLFSVYDSNSKVGFILDLCTGGHLGDLVKRTPQKYLSEDYCKILIRQLVSAVTHMHSKGICHRDIKLQNILLENMDDAHAQLKLIDFGFAARFVGMTPLKTRCGTPYATAPEVYRECYDERCDVWSIGVVTYTLLSGHRPFTSVDLPGDLKNAGRAAMVANILMARYHFNYPAFHSLSAEGFHFIQSMLQPDYESRWHASDAMNSSWLGFSDHKTKFDISTLREMDTALSVAVSNLKTKGSISTLGNTSLVAVAFSQPQDNASELRTLFQSFDTENVGYLSR